jgi:hypothetical protein
MTDVAVHPVQNNHRASRSGLQPCAPQVVTLRAYEVYRHVYGDQRALIEDGCRGGFGVGELIAFLYAYGFPRNEWRARVDEALRGLRL